MKHFLGAPILFFALMFSCTSAQAEESGERWHLFLKDTAYSIRYYDPEGVTRTSSEHVTVWTKTIPTAEGNPRIKEIDSLWEIDCPKKVFRNLETKVLYTSGETEEGRTPYDWSKVQPEIWIAPLFEIVCEKKSKVQN